jgi:hypothetical protein
MLRQTFSSIATAAMVFVAAPVAATPLTVGSGWNDDVIGAPGATTSNSPWTFTIGTPSILSIVDGFIPGDTYTISGDLSGITSFYAGSLTDVQASGTYGAAWTDDSYSKLALWIAPGTYSFSITGDGAGGTPAGLGVRLDAAAMPEPASWALMVGGLGAIGAVMRRRRQHVRNFI